MEALQVVLGKFRTRNQRLVEIDETFEVFDAEQPGMSPTRRMIFRGWLYQADGRTHDSRHDWEPSGRYRTPNGVATEYDLRELVSVAPPKAEPESTKPDDDAGDLAHVLLDYQDPSDQNAFDTLNRLIAERDHGAAICAMLATMKSDGESDADTLQRLINDSCDHMECVKLVPADGQPLAQEAAAGDDPSMVTVPEGGESPIQKSQTPHKWPNKK